MTVGMMLLSHSADMADITASNLSARKLILLKCAIWGNLSSLDIVISNRHRFNTMGFNPVYTRVPLESINSIQKM